MIIALLALILIYIVPIAFLCAPNRRGFSEHGKYRVRYQDGQVSRRCHIDTARDYAEIFGGKVEKAKTV